MNQKIIEWLAENTSEFSRMSLQYSVSIPTLYKVSKGGDLKIQRRIKTTLELAYKERNKK